MAQGVNLRKLHRVTAAMLAAFILLHLANHLAILIGPGAHLSMMEAIRPLYRNPVVEPLLFAAFAVQLALGLRLMWRRGWPRALWPRIQVTSGGLFALFLIQHLGAVLYMRTAEPDLDTNIYWAAAVVSRAPFSLYFIPYYIIGLAALGIHIAAMRRSVKLASISAILACVIVAGFAGAFHDIQLPPAYEAYLDRYSLAPKN